MNIKKNKLKILHLFIIFLTSFLLGGMFSFNIGDYIGNTSGKINFIYKKEDLNLDKFWKVFNLIKNNNYDYESINKEDLMNSIIKGLVIGLGDQHSEYLTKKEKTEFNNILSGDFEGIGAVVNKNIFGVNIERLIKGSPAIKYGLKKGDIIIKANSESLEGLSLFDSVVKIKGPAGTKVLLEVVRGGDNILKIEVTRDKISIPSVHFEKYNNGKIGYISINLFGEKTFEEFKKSIKENINTHGLIIDLRDNGGGFLQSSVLILSELIKNNKLLVTTKYNNFFSNRPYISYNNGNIYKGKIVVLINENSASASEITALVLKDYKKAILIGKKTYGKGSVQEPFILKDGSLLKLTVAKWFTPNGVSIDKQGVNPDIEINFKEEDFKNNYDRQLEEAKKILKDFIKTKNIKITIDNYRYNNKIK